MQVYFFSKLRFLPIINEIVKIEKINSKMVFHNKSKFDEQVN